MLHDFNQQVMAHETRKAVRQEQRTGNTWPAIWVRSRQELFARLASLSSLADADKKTRGALLDILSRTNYSMVHSLAPFRENGTDSQWSALLHIHQKVYAVINGLLNGEEIELRQLAEAEHAKVQVTKTGKIMPLPDGSMMLNEPLVELWRVLRDFTFPFRRCPMCSAVFIPVKRQKYCSPPCTAAAMAEKAKHSDERREYMRNYMAERRKRAKKRGVKSRGPRGLR